MIKVLIADDHNIVIDGIRSFLEKEREIEVVASVSNGLQVLDILEEQSVDVVILDIEMPVLDGITTAKAIRSNYPKTKILILTMYDKSPFILKLLQIGVHGYLLKNKTKETLIGAIHTVHQNGRYFPLDILDKAADLTTSTKEEQIQLTEREKQVLCLVGKAFSAKEISSQLEIEVTTVVTHISNLRQKLNLRNVQALAVYAVTNGHKEC